MRFYYTYHDRRRRTVYAETDHMIRCVQLLFSFFLFFFFFLFFPFFPFFYEVLHDVAYVHVVCLRVRLPPAFPQFLRSFPPLLLFSAK